jgi:hypothetical protein
MYTGLLHTHSSLRYLVLILLVAVIVRSLMGWMGKKPFNAVDNKLSLFLLIFTHVQLLVGLALYFISPVVIFSAETMANKTLRYFAVEHLVGMLIAVVLITVARASSKRLSDDTAKHKRLFVLNAIALLVVVVILGMSGRGII